jgi:hypothetical protein
VLPAPSDQDLDDRLVGPPVLLPAVIFRQIFDDGDPLPIWARPRVQPVVEPAPPPQIATTAAGPEPPATKAAARPRRPKAPASTAGKPITKPATKPATKPRRPRKSA